MKREVIRIAGREYPLYVVQTIVVGSGAAGLNAAVSLYKEGRTDVAIVTEGRWMGTSHNTGSDKQTYYKLTTSGSEPDSVYKMAQTLFAGGSMDGDLALAEAALSLRGFYHLVDIGVPFPCNGSGEYVGYKTDHDPNQRGTSAGPLTSKYMTEALWKETERCAIPVFDGYQVIELLTDRADADSPDAGSGSGETRVRGVLALHCREPEAEKQYTVFAADNVVYAVGGEAGMYATSVYPVSQTGGMGAALRAGARGKNLTESQYGLASVRFRWNLSGTYQQVIPRYVSTAADGSDAREFLDEYFARPADMLHAIFLKGYQWPFDPRKAMDGGSSLIDILVYQERVMRGRRVYLDYRSNPAAGEKDGRLDEGLLKPEAYEYLKNSDGLWETPIARLEHMNPSAVELYRQHGIDLHTEMLEIAVCAQHNNGGLEGNCWWESNLRHLFPVGEVNGSHGVYRPGGSALNSGQAGSLRAAQFIARCYAEEPLGGQTLTERCGGQIASAVAFGMSAFDRDRQKLDLKAEKGMLGARMSAYGANIRSLDGVTRALAENRRQQERVAGGGIGSAAELKHLYRLRDLLVSQQVYLEAAADYIRRGGASRGSCLVYDANGRKPLAGLPELFRFSVADRGFSSQIQETEYHGGKCIFNWRKVRPIPEEDGWFEKVWRDWREGTYYQGQ